MQNSNLLDNQNFYMRIEGKFAATARYEKTEKKLLHLKIIL